LCKRPNVLAVDGPDDAGRGNHGIPLEERRCTVCGRGVADGAEFRTRHHPGGYTSHYPYCRECESKGRLARREALRKLREDVKRIIDAAYLEAAAIAREWSFFRAREEVGR
jgi:hypothetical protein